MKTTCQTLATGAPACSTERPGTGVIESAFVVACTRAAAGCGSGPIGQASLKTRRALHADMGAVG